MKEKLKLIPNYQSSSGRSQSAEGYLNRLPRKRINAESGRIERPEAINPFAMMVIKPKRRKSQLEFAKSDVISRRCYWIRVEYTLSDVLNANAAYP